MSTGTNWDAYYARPYRTSSLTRRMMGRILVRCVRQYGGVRQLHVVELGGANSCFYDTLKRECRPVFYTVVDNNQFGLQAFREKTHGEPVGIEFGDVLDLHIAPAAELVFSVGLIEHFSPALTARAIAAHFDMVREGGIVIITFPTPTVLYRVTRAISERLGMWIFHDERPLQMAEVLATVRSHGTVLHTTVVWRIVLTQGLIVAKKTSGSVRGDSR